MKTNKIVTEEQFNEALLIINDSITYQNNKKIWLVFGTYGCTIYFSNVGEKHLNDWKRFDYNSFCEEMDKIEIGLPF